MAETPIPIRISRIPAMPFLNDRPYIRSATPRPATTATRETTGPFSDRTTMAKTAAALAPELMPMMSGLARGLRSMIWKATPASPKLRPASTQRTARGNRNRPTVKAAFDTSSPSSTRITCSGGVKDWPSESVSAKIATTRASSAAITKKCLRARRRRLARTRSSEEEIIVTAREPADAGQWR